MTLSTPESYDLSACTPVWSQRNKNLSLFPGLCIYAAGEKLFWNLHKFVTILNCSKAEPGAFFFEMKRGRNPVRAFLILEPGKLFG